MQQENYYQILAVPYHATSVEIKRAYRKKALLYHPDKNKNTESSTEKFQSVQTAYAILSNASSRKLYDKTIFSEANQPTVISYTTAEEIVKEADKLNSILSRQNQFFVDRDWLKNECIKLISNDHLQLLATKPALKKQLLEAQLKSFQYLPYNEIADLLTKWQNIVQDDQLLLDQLNKFIQQKKLASFWENNQWIISIIIGLIITFLIMKG